MPISPVGAQGTGSTTAGATATANLPAGIQSGDLIVASFATATTATVTTPPAGYTLLETMTETNHIQSIYYKIATASESAPATLFSASSRWIAGCSVYRGVDSTTPFVAEAGAFEAANSVNHTTPVVNNTDATAWALTFWVARFGDANLLWTPPGTLTQRLHHDLDIATANSALMIADSNGAVAAGNTSYTATTSAATAVGSQWLGFMKPAAGASNLDKLRLGSSVVGLRVGVDTPSKVYAGAVQIWP